MYVERAINSSRSRLRIPYSILRIGIFRITFCVLRIAYCVLLLAYGVLRLATFAMSDTFTLKPPHASRGGSRTAPTIYLSFQEGLSYKPLFSGVGGVSLFIPFGLKTRMGDQIYKRLWN